MSRIKWSKLLVGTAVIGATIAGGIAYFKKHKKSDECLDDDFDDFDDDFDKDSDFDDVVTFHKSEREYVSIPKDTVPAASAKDESPATDSMKEDAKPKTEEQSKIIFPSSDDNQLSNKDAGQLDEAIEAEVSMRSVNINREIWEINNNSDEADDNDDGINNNYNKNSDIRTEEQS